jgi:predicted dithiol-disulfide oxidoreductase (DUF899 family)
MTKTSVEHPKIVSEADWLAARKELLAAEKEFTRQRDALSAKRREMPWVKVEKNYEFDTPAGKKSLGELFAGRSQLIVYHFMLGPDWVEGCRSCSFLADTIEGAFVHVAHRDATLTAISRAPLAQIEAFKKRMGWHFPWASSNRSDFNFDYDVSFRDQDRVNGKVYYNYRTTEFPVEEAPGLSVFAKNSNGSVYHTYSSYGRGLDILIGAYNYLDLTPKGRDENGLSFSMAWVRHHDKYEDGYVVDPKAGYVPPAVVKPSCCAAEHRS